MAAHQSGEPVMHEQATSLISGATMQTASLMGLPAELRNRVYEYVLVYDEPIDLRPWRHLSGDPRSLREKVMQPALTRTSRQVREEALPIFYGLNTFRLGLDTGNAILLICEESYEDERWLQAIGPSNRRLLVDCRIYVSARCVSGKAKYNVDCVPWRFERLGLPAELGPFDHEIVGEGFTWVWLKVTFK